MALHALENVDDAIDATKEFLLPFTWSRWLRLAFVVFFVGGGAGLNAPTNTAQFTSTGGGGGGGGGVGGPGAFPPDSLGGIDVVLVVVAVVLAVVLLGLVFGLVGAVMEFVFVRSLSDTEVHVRQYFGRYWRKGVRLFGFRFGVTLLALLFVGLLAGALAFGLLGAPSTWGAAGIVGLLFVVLPVVLLVFIVVGIVNGFTTVFVVPVMLLEDRNVLSAWRRFWPTVRSEPKQFLAYVLMSFVLGIGAGLVSAIVIGFGALVAAIPFVLVGAVAFFAGGSVFSLGVVAVLAAIGLVYLLLFLAGTALVKVPVQSFLRYYALLVLGDIEPEFDIVPGIRDRVREDEGDTGERGGQSGPVSPA